MIVELKSLQCVATAQHFVKQKHQRGREGSPHSRDPITCQTRKIDIRREKMKTNCDGLEK